MDINKENNILSGIDISHWQKAIDWPTVMSGSPVKFVIAKATEGATWQDPKFQSHWQAMKRQGVPITGAYHYFRGTSLPSDQASNIVTQLKQVSFNHADDLLAISVAKQDKLTPAEVADYLLWIISNLTAPIIPEKVILYTSPAWWDTHVQDVGHRLSQHPLWVAHWTTAAQPRLPVGWSDWMIWQQSSQGRINGIQGFVDLNQMKSTTTQAVTRVRTGLADDAHSDELTTATTVGTVSAEPAATASVNQTSSLLNGLKSLKNLVNTLLLPPIDHELEEILTEGRQLMNQSDNLIQWLAGSESFINKNSSNSTSGHHLVQPNAPLPVNQTLPSLINSH